MILVREALALAVFLVLGGCASGVPFALPVESPRTPAITAEEIDLAQANVLQPMRLRHDDSVKLVVLGFPELTHVARVQGDGLATFPLVGNIRAAGRTIDEVRDEIRTRLRGSGHAERIRIEPDDQIRFAVWRQQELTHVATVQADGRVSFPLIGEMDAAGRTLEEIRNEAAERLSAHLRDPRVSILPERMRRMTIANPQISLLPEKVRESRVAVVGEVFVPGLYPIGGGLRVMDLLAQSRYKDQGELDNVVVIRNTIGSGKPQYRLLKLGEFIAGRAPDQNLYLVADDIVFVPKSTIAEIGDFIDRFFTRTRPVFDWWTALQNARYAEDAAKVNQRLVELLGN